MYRKQQTTQLTYLKPAACQCSTLTISCTRQ